MVSNDDCKPVPLVSEGNGRMKKYPWAWENSCK